MTDSLDTPLSPIAFRAPTLADAPRMADLYDAEVPHGHFVQVAPVPGATAGLMEAAIRRGRVTMAVPFVPPVQDAAVWAEVAERAGRVIGFSMTKDWVWPGQVRHAAGRPRDVELWYLAVDPAERRRGTGGELLHRQVEAALRVAAARGHVFARCYRPSAGAKRLLLRMDFAVVADSGASELLHYQGQWPR